MNLKSVLHLFLAILIFALCLDVQARDPDLRDSSGPGDSADLCMQVSEQKFLLQKQALKQSVNTLNEGARLQQLRSQEMEDMHAGILADMQKKLDELDARNAAELKTWDEKIALKRQQLQSREKLKAQLDAMLQQCGEMQASLQRLGRMQREQGRRLDCLQVRLQEDNDRIRLAAHSDGYWARIFGTVTTYATSLSATLRNGLQVVGLLECRKSKPMFFHKSMWLRRELLWSRPGGSLAV